MGGSVEEKIFSGLRNAGIKFNDESAYYNIIYNLSSAGFKLSEDKLDSAIMFYQNNKDFSRVRNLRISKVLSKDELPDDISVLFPILTEGVSDFTFDSLRVGVECVYDIPSEFAEEILERCDLGYYETFNYLKLMGFEKALSFYEEASNDILTLLHEHPGASGVIYYENSEFFLSAYDLVKKLGLEDKIKVFLERYIKLAELSGEYIDLFSEVLSDMTEDRVEEIYKKGREFYLSNGYFDCLVDLAKLVNKSKEEV